jgi:hypothetical protein
MACNTHWNTLLKQEQMLCERYCPEATSRKEYWHSPLILATLNGHTNIVQRLLRCPDIKMTRLIYMQGNYRNPAEVASIKGYKAISELIRNHEKGTLLTGETPFQDQDWSEGMDFRNHEEGEFLTGETPFQDQDWSEGTDVF